MTVHWKAGAAPAHISGKSHRQAFTLVELLVVIGIIALLISILLPSLARARQAATNVACQSNLRQIGQLLHMYVKDNRDQLPWGVSPAWVSWMQALAETMGAAGSGLPKIAMCPDAENPHGIVRLHYSANPRAFSSRDFVNTSDPLTFWDPDLSTPPVKMSTIRPAAETGLIWDAPLFINGSHMSEEFEALPVNQFLDNYAYSNSWQHYMIRGRDTNVEQERVWGDPKTCNRDIALGKWDLWTWDDAKMHGFRYRHQGNTSLNMLFADGHVEGIRAGEVRRHHTFVSVRIMK